MRQLLLPALFLLPLTGCRCTDEVYQVPGAVDQVDVFDQKAAAQVDILWIIDNSESMAAEQFKIASRFNQFFNQLITSQVDYHIGIVTSDDAEMGVLRAYEGTDVPGCAGCRFIDNSVACADPAVDVSGMSDAEAEAALMASCPAQLVFRRLVRVGIDGSSLEEGFEQAARALGAYTIDPATALPDPATVPDENAGFLRQAASLYIIFVSDEEEGAKQDAPPVRYYQRLFEGLKGAGNENKVAVAAITGYPAVDPPADVSDVCPILETTFDSTIANDDSRAAALVEALRNFRGGCYDEEAADPEGADFAETGGRYIELACRTGGVIADMCAADYSTALDALGANAAGLLRKFTLSKPLCAIEAGQDTTLFTEDDLAVDCDDDGDKAGALDGPLCVTARGLGSAEGSEALVPRTNEDGTENWQYEPGTNSVRFDNAYLPAPGSAVQIRYLLARKSRCEG